jgi:hypothetical protein
MRFYLYLFFLIFCAYFVPTSSIVCVVSVVPIFCANKINSSYQHSQNLSLTDIRKIFHFSSHFRYYKCLRVHRPTRKHLYNGGAMVGFARVRKERVCLTPA